MFKSQALRTLITNSAIMGLGLINSVVLARWLGTAGRGEIAAAMLWPTLLVYISSLGMITATIYFAAQPESNAETILTNGIVLSGIQALIAVPVGFWALPRLLASQSPIVVSASRLYLAIIPISLITQYSISIIQGRMHIAALNWLRLIIPVGYLTGVVGFWASGILTLLNIVILQIFLNSVCLIAALGLLYGSGIHPRFGVNGRLLRQMLKYGRRVQVGDITGLANLSLDQVLMAAFLAPTSLGLYVIAVSSAAVAQVLSQAVRIVLIPRIAHAPSSEKTVILQQVFRRYWLFSLLVAISVGFVLPVVIPLVYGQNFRGAIWPAEVLLVGAFAIGAKEVLAGGAQALGDPWLGSKAHLWSLAVTVILLSVLLPVMGILGAAVATSVAHTTQLVIVVSGLHRMHNMSPLRLFSIKVREVPDSVSLLLSLIKPHKSLMAEER